VSVLEQLAALEGSSPADGRVCKGCGETFTPRSPRQLRCYHSCGRTRKGRSLESNNGARDRRRDEHEVVFVGVDGEGLCHCPRGESGEVEALEQVCDHAYVLLSVGAHSLAACRQHGPYRFTGDDASCPTCGRYNPRELSTLEVFDHLWQCFEAQLEAAFVGYYLGYDIGHWFKGLPAEIAEALYNPERPRPHALNRNPKPEPVVWEGWEFDILNGRRLRLHRQGALYRSGGKWRKRWLYVCDVGSFFQSSFEKAIDPAEWTAEAIAEVVTSDEQTIIEHGKRHLRGVARLTDELVIYNRTENAVLSRLMSVFNRGLVDMGIRLMRTQWFGPGQAAQHWLNSVNCPTGDRVREITDPEVVDACRRSYFGGWFETPAHGHIGFRRVGDPDHPPTFDADIHSAYPSIIAGLPCLEHGQWTFTEGAPPRGLRRRKGALHMVHAEVWGRDEIVGAMPHRTPEGHVLRPHHTRGCYWLHEIDASRAAGLISRTRIAWCWSYVPDGNCPCAHPVAKIAELYLERIRVGKKTPLGRALKLVYNSVYGKFAQSIGNPKYGNSIYASLITAGCRVKILEAIASHPHGTRDLVMVATDGIVFRTRHTALHETHHDLGTWEQLERRGLTVMRPGVYWDDVTRAEPESLKLKSRGIPGRTMRDNIGEVDEQFDTFDGWQWPSVEIVVPFTVISPRQALRSLRDWTRCAEIVHNRPVLLNAAPVHKRTQDANRVRSVWRTSVRRECDPVESSEYDKLFGADDYGDDAGDIDPADMMTPTGPVLETV